ncbi:MAG TPA: cupin domain-containing protein [Phycisphaerae bacterium]|nr:cupin domain-containing protein [Phycisphaerae bacterium]
MGKMKNLSEGKPVEAPPGIVRKTLSYNDEAMLCYFSLQAGAEIPLHDHRATQIGYVISGEVRFLAENTDDEFEVVTGDSYVFNPHVKHGAVVLKDTEYIEVFTPPRGEYKDF